MIRPMWEGHDGFAEMARDERFLVGVSGGADSVALLQLLTERGFDDLVVCHLNHGLRGAESEADERFVVEMAESLGHRVAVGQWRFEEGGSSMETAAREARHRFFMETARTTGCRKVVLGHHADDQAETALWNLLRGSRGAVGMKPVQRIVCEGVELEILRPLRGVRRAELRAWLRERGIAWREDATNAEPVAVRNRLRHEAIPLLDEITGRDAVAALVKAVETTRELGEIEAWAVEQAAAMDPQGRLHVGRLDALPAAVRRACVFRYLQSAGVVDLGRAEVERVLGMLEEGGAAKVSLPGGRIARRRQGRLWVEE